jgi:hypothetical protein
MVLLMAALLCGCTRPYRTAVSGDAPGTTIGPFTGLNGLLAKHQVVSVLWTHGMGPHYEPWARGRADLVAAALGGTIKSIGEQRMGGGQMMSFTIIVGTHRLELNFLLWTSMVDPYRNNLRFDDATDQWLGDFWLERAGLNGELKTQLMNRDLIDAVVYSGRNGDPIRETFATALCWFLGGTSGRADACRFGPDRLTEGARVIVGESLSSKMVYDATTNLHLANRSSAAEGALRARLAGIAAVFMMANQIPLLDQANPVTAVAPGAVTARPSSLRNFAELAAGGKTARAGGEALDLVVFSDPNDLLSYRIPPWYFPDARVRVVNVTVSNADTYAGYVERPDYAHCDYLKNSNVLGLLLMGYPGTGPVPRIAARGVAPGCEGA